MPTATRRSGAPAATPTPAPTAAPRRLRAPAAPSTPAPAPAPAPATAPATPARRARPTRQESGEVTVTSEAYGHEEVSEQRLPSRVFPPGVEPAHVRLGIGKTISLGDFEFLRIDAAVTLPCLPEEVPDTLVEAGELAARALLDEECAWMGPPKAKAGRRG
jgi:hypothetical protein